MAKSAKNAFDIWIDCLRGILGLFLLFSCRKRQCTRKVKGSKMRQILKLPIALVSHSLGLQNFGHFLGTALIGKKRLCPICIYEDRKHKPEKVRLRE